MKLRIVISYSPRYRRAHLIDFVPPVTGIHLAALARGHDVELCHEQVRDVPVDDEPDLVAISFFSGFARKAYALADRYRALGVPWLRAARTSRIGLKKRSSTSMPS